MNIPGRLKQQEAACGIHACKPPGLAAQMIALQELAKDLANFGKEQGRHIAAAKAKLKAAKAGVEAARKVAKAKQAALAEVTAQCQAAGAERDGLIEQEKAAQLAVQGREPSVLPIE